MARRGQRRRQGGEPGRQRGGRLWVLVALFFLGGVAALLSASRRSQFERRWEELADVEPPEPGPPGDRPPPSVPSLGREVEGRHGRLFVDDGGVDGLPVFFVHGLGGTSRQWRAQLSHLRPERRALALDLRGHGDSDAAPSDAFTVDDLAADVADTAAALGLERFVLAGHGLGATVAIDYAARNPRQVAGLLLVDPNGDQTEIPRRELDELLEALRRDPEGERGWYFRQILVGSEPEVADQVLADLSLLDPEAFVTALEASFGYSPRPALAAYPGPKLAVVSDMNNLPYSLHKLVPELPWTLIPGTSHWVMMDRPDAFNGALDEFLDTVDA